MRGVVHFLLATISSCVFMRSEVLLLIHVCDYCVCDTGPANIKETFVCHRQYVLNNVSSLQPATKDTYIFSSKNI